MNNPKEVSNMASNEMLRKASSSASLLLLGVGTLAACGGEGS